jgi:mRNA-degrading endonuclease RelE of RelBE toxin-antitoxin system
MAYRVVLADSAKADASVIYDRVVEAASDQGSLWFQALIDCLYSLDQHPTRCPLAREAKKTHREIRCLLFGKQRNVYRILFQIDEQRKTVWVLHIRHGARADMKPAEITRLKVE